MEEISSYEPADLQIIIKDALLFPDWRPPIGRQASYVLNSFFLALGLLIGSEVEPNNRSCRQSSGDLYETFGQED